jgi:O-antigen/teichoic acid export membrane protein
MHTLGVYSMVATVCIIIETGIISVISAFQPYIFDAYAENDKRGIGEFYKSFLSVCILIVSAIILVGSNIQFMVKNPALAASLNMVPLMGSGFVFSALYSTYALRIAYAQKPNYHLFICTFFSILNILLNLLLIKPMGIYGIIVAGLVAKIAQCITTIYFAEKCASSSVWKFLFFVSTISFCNIIICWWLYQQGALSILEAAVLQFFINVVLILGISKPRTLLAFVAKKWKRVA